MGVLMTSLEEVRASPHKLTPRAWVRDYVDENETPPA